MHDFYINADMYLGRKYMKEVHVCKILNYRPTRSHNILTGEIMITMKS